MGKALAQEEGNFPLLAFALSGLLHPGSRPIRATLLSLSQEYEGTDNRDPALPAMDMNPSQ